MRVISIALLPLVLSSCVWALLGDPMADTDYVITQPESLNRVAAIVRDVAVQNGLRLVPLKKPQVKYIKAQYTDFAPGGGLTIGFTLYSSNPTLIEISEAWTASRSAKHRKIAGELEARLNGAAIAFHKATGDEFVKLRDQHLKT
jgi:hypothetical protein